MASQIEILKQNLLELLNILRFLSISQLQMIVNFDRREESINPEEASKIIQNCDNSQLETLLKLSQLQATNEISLQKNSIDDKFVKSLSNSQIGAIGFIYRTYLLQEMIQKSLSIDLLMKIVEITPYKGYPDHQLKFLHQFQQLLGHLMPNTIASLHEDVKSGDGEELLELLEDHQDQFLLYQPLRSLLRLDFEDVSQFYESFPKFRSHQLVQLVRLMQLDPLNILEIRQLLSPKGWMGLQSLIEGDIEIEEMNNSHLNPFVSLVILEQPSDQTVYKRNLKPFPTVMVTGDERKVLAHDECLVVVPVLYRCDNLTPVAKLTGDAPIKVTSGNTAKFKKLKIMITSRQLADTLFCLRFELRKQKIGTRNNNNNDQTETITFVQSNPISVVSHSTLMKKTPPSVQPTINEIIPANGSSSGGNKVVIIGSNFVDSPVLRVRFDNTDVTPDFHGSGTLVCTAPQHIPGPVSVSVSNDAKTWSETTATYIYQDNLFNSSNSSVIAEEYDVSRSTFAIEKSIFESVTKLDQSFFRNMSNHVVPDFNFVDARGYTPLHYVAVTGDVAIAHFFLTNNAEVNARDPNGNTPLHWAVLSGNVNLIPLFVYFGSSLNVPNYFGESPLHFAISSQQLDVAEYLIKCGANVNSTALCGETPLHYASVLCENLVSLLIQNGAYVNFTDSDGDSPLHWATRECLFPIVNLLLKEHSFANLQNEDGESPFHLAVSSEDSFFINNLLDLAKFDLNLHDCSGASPIQIALESGLFSISEQLAKHGAIPPHFPSVSLSSAPVESLAYILKNLNLNPSTTTSTTSTTPQPFGVSHCTATVSV